MSIHTRFGFDYEIVAKDVAFPEVPWLWCRRVEDGLERWVSLADLRADGGAVEIMAKADIVPVKPYVKPAEGIPVSPAG